MEGTAGNRTRTVPRKHRHWNYYIRTFISYFNMSKELTETLSKIERKDSTPTLKGLASLDSHPHNKINMNRLKINESWWGHQRMEVMGPTAP